MQLLEYRPCAWKRLLFYKSKGQGGTRKKNFEMLDCFVRAHELVLIQRPPASPFGAVQSLGQALFETG